MKNANGSKAGSLKVYPVFITFKDGEKFTYPAQSKDGQMRVATAMLDSRYVESVAVPSD